MFLHVVKPGETLYQIAQRYNVSVDRLVVDNAISDPNKLAVGQSLLIRHRNFKYRIRPNETFYQLAKKFGISLRQLLFYNQNIASPSLVYPGMEINIVYDNPNKVPMAINGFVYPEVNLDVLRKMLPYLTYLAIFSYQISQDGTINNINDEALIKEARRFRVAPLFTITNIDVSKPGEFSSELIHNILVNEARVNKLIEDIAKIMQDKNYYGAIIDFEYLYPEDREKYNQFLEKAARRLNALGYVVMSAIAPKTRADQPGLLYEAHDYSAHGRLLNRVIIMTYEWGYIFGPALPVAPIDQVEEVIKYAITEIPHEKILMGVPNYGYDFKVPFVEGSMAELITNPQAIDIAIRVGAAIKFNETSQTPFFTYYEKDRKSVV